MLNYFYCPFCTCAHNIMSCHRTGKGATVSTYNEVGIALTHQPMADCCCDCHIATHHLQPAIFASSSGNTFHKNNTRISLLSFHRGDCRDNVFWDVPLCSLVTTSNCGSTANWLQRTIHLSLLCLHHFSGNRFQRGMFHFLWVPELSPCLSYQLLTATAHNDRTAAVL
jgi:hypothetical protein